MIHHCQGRTLFLTTLSKVSRNGNTLWTVDSKQLSNKKSIIGSACIVSEQYPTVHDCILSTHDRYWHGTWQQNARFLKLKRKKSALRCVVFPASDGCLQAKETQVPNWPIFRKNPVNVTFSETGPYAKLSRLKKSWHDMVTDHIQCSTLVSLIDLCITWIYFLCEQVLEKGIKNGYKYIYIQIEEGLCPPPSIFI